MKALFTVTLLTFLMMVVSSSLVAQEAKQGEKAWSKLNATWQPVVMKLSGSDLPKAQMESIKLTMKDGKYEMKSDGGFEQTGKVSLGEVTEGKPAQMDIEFENEEKEIKKIQAIYKFENGKLVICYRMEGDRPAVFESNRENQNLYIEYEKAK